MKTSSLQLCNKIQTKFIQPVNWSSTCTKCIREIFKTNIDYFLLKYITNQKHECTFYVVDLSISAHTSNILIYSVGNELVYHCTFTIYPKNTGAVNHFGIESKQSTNKFHPRNIQLDETDQKRRNKPKRKDKTITFVQRNTEFKTLADYIHYKFLHYKLTLLHFFAIKFFFL